ncbi:ATP-binding protein [Motilibacter aurantiacus]|uniref:ATP-binding protein n=1 Tax=Motilibacter aurantiacus TaxID=2714955 RepID=UPI00140DF93E|nr:ATP-binding protein [Motilibacter aurantiacus]NHC44339.1 ATP-binding protein [Motilibacter aurantiacus]
MTTVTVRFSALPAHVRTARLVAAAVARRSGVDEGVLDEVRLAVGEACSRAVDLHQRHSPDVPVTLQLTDAGTSFRVEVVDAASPDAEPDASLVDLAETAESPDGLDGGALPSNVGIAVISGLVDDLAVERRGDGLALRMTWPLSGSAKGGVAPTSATAS